MMRCNIRLIGSFSGVVVGKVLSVERHPKAHRLPCRHRRPATGGRGTPWSIAGADAPDRDDAAALYDKLEKTVLPLYYGYSGDQAGWIAVMKGVISKNASYFNSHRMMRRHVTEAYMH